MNSEIGILGYGEVGKAISQLYEKPRIKDLERDDGLKGIEILNVCIPWSDNFIEIVKKEIEENKPKLVIIHSTVAPGTIKKLSQDCLVVHSPVRGIHPNLFSGVKTFIKYIGSDNKEAGLLAKEHLESLGLKTKIFKNSATTELGKLFSTSYYGLCIAWHGEMERTCKDWGVDFQKAVTDFNKTYNEGYKKLGKENVLRPVLYPPEDGIGGHCIIGNAEILENYTENKALDLILSYKSREFDFTEDSFVSVVVPCYNEEKFIANCLDSLMEQDFPKEKMEVLVIDGNSNDRTKEIVKEYTQRHPFIKLFNNENRFTPFAMNIGIKESKGDFVLKLDAHADYDKNYISECVKNLKKYSDADCVGGITQTVPKYNRLIPKAIVTCLTHFFGAGSSAFRTIKKKDIKEPLEVDAIFGACYRKEVFEKIGLFNENLIRSQDMELSMRIKDNGGKILLLPETVVYYYPKDNLLDFWKHNLIDGVWAIYPLKFMKRPLKLRHLIPFFFTTFLASTLILSFLNPFFLYLFLSVFLAYLIVSLYFSFKIALKEKKLIYFFVLPLIFFVRHFGYGLGSLWGMFKLMTNNKETNNKEINDKETNNKETNNK